MPVGDTASLLPVAICAIPAVVALITYPLARAARPLGPVLNLLGAGVATVLSVSLVLRTVRGEVLVSLAGELRADALSALMVVAISGVSLAAAVYAFAYMRLEPLLARVSQAAGVGMTKRRLATFYALSQAFLVTMLWACLTNNIIMLYVAVEGTTIASGLLVCFYWDRRALEAGYKYLILLTVGIAFALFGCVFLYASAVPYMGEEAGVRAMLMSELPEAVVHIPRAIALLIMAVTVVGFGTKAGLAPFHAWVPDAYAESPSVVSAVLSGVASKVAIYAVVRILVIFFPVAEYHPVSVFVIVLAAFTMLLGGVMCLAQDDLKRLVAYSSVSQMGYIAMGFGVLGLGYGGVTGYLGGYGGLFHLVTHVLSKAALFLAVGAIIYATAGRRRMSELRGLARRMPVTAVIFFAAAFAISGMPPFNGFWSKLTLYLAAARADLWWALGIAIAASLLTLIAFIRAGYRVFWSDGEEGAGEPEPEVREVPAAMLVPMGVLAALCLIIGLYPQVLHPILDPATRALAGIF